MASVLFSITLISTIDSAPQNYLGYMVIGFTVLGIYTGINIGKKTAYTVHDRELMSERMKGKGVLTGTAGSFMNIPILFATIILVGWTVFMLSVGFVWQAVTDEIFLREVRWIAIVAMLSLIIGSYLFYRAKSSLTDKMLSFWGKKTEKQSKLINKAMEESDAMEEKGEELLKSSPKIGVETVDYMKRRFL